MNTKQINNFAKSCISVMETFGVSANYGEAVFRQSPLKADSIVIVIGLTGDLHGQAIISMEQDSAFFVASKMMGMEVTQMDEVTKSAISELTNMVIGNAITLLSKEDVLLDMTPPSVLTGENINISTATLCISIPFNMEGNRTMEFSLSAKEITK